MPVSKSSQPAAAQVVTFRIGNVEFPAPWWSAPGAALYLGDVRACLRKLPARSVHCCVTSPPYWGLRDYGTGQWEGGSAECDHEPTQEWIDHNFNARSASEGGAGTQSAAAKRRWYKANGSCSRCGARRIDMQIGAEPSPDCGTHGQAQCGACFVCSMVGVFREVHRVMRDDGTCWLNLGDSYTNGVGETGRNDGDRKYGRNESKIALVQSCVRSERRSGHRKPLPSGNLVGIPWRAALALQADGWVLRQDIIWHSPNKMPESVTNRCTKSHEHIFLLAKGDGYYFDAVAIEDDAVPGTYRTSGKAASLGQAIGSGRQPSGNGVPGAIWSTGNTKNKRDVWIVPTQGYPGAHFAVYSPRLITPCILAGTSEHGCCARCGAPWERVTVKERAESRVSGGGNCFGKQLDGAVGAGAQQEDNYRQVVGRAELGWRKACGCQTDEVTPAVVIDPFVGSGTTVSTAMQLGRAGIGIDLSEVYLRENAVPRIEAALPGSARRQATVAMPPEPLPPARKLRG